MLEYIDPLKSFLSIRLVIGMNNSAASANYTSGTVSCLKPIVCSTAGCGDFIPYLAKNPLCGYLISVDWVLMIKQYQI